MLRPVELDAARDPRAGEADERRLHDMVVVDEIIVVRLVDRAVDAAAEFRQHHDLQIPVLEIHRVIYLVDLFILDLVDHGVRIHAARTTLIDALLEKHRILVRLPDLVRRKRDRFLPDSDFLLFHEQRHLHAIH